MSCSPKQEILFFQCGSRLSLVLYSFEEKFIEKNPKKLKLEKKRLYTVTFHFFDILEKGKNRSDRKQIIGCQREGLTIRDMRKLYEVMEILFILVVGVIMQLYTFIETFQLCSLKGEFYCM